MLPISSRLSNTFPYSLNHLIHFNLHTLTPSTLTLTLTQRYEHIEVAMYVINFSTESLFFSTVHFTVN